MSFDWQQDSKERYFKRAEQQIEAAGFGDILKINRAAFSTVRDIVKVHLEPIDRKGNMRRWWEAKRLFENLKEKPTPKDSYDRKIKTLFIHGWMIFEMEEQDR